MSRLTRLVTTFSALALVAWAGACSDAEPLSPVAREVGLGEPFALRPGEYVRLRETQTVIGFSSVVEDSRCPVGPLILCAWQGNARVRLIAGPESYLPEVPHAEFYLNTGIEPRYHDLGLLRITLEAVAPAARLEPPPPGQYRVTLVATLRP